MGLSRLSQLLSNTTGSTLYVNPDSIDSTDSIENRGNSPTRPFYSLNRALAEAVRFSYQIGLNNDRFSKCTIILSPGIHRVTNRPGWIPDGSSNFKKRDGTTSSDFTQWDVNTNFDITTENNALYKLNSVHGGIILPRGVSIIGDDYRKTIIVPDYIPNPINDNVERSAVFLLTGQNFINEITIDDPTGAVYVDYTSNKTTPLFSQHKLTDFEYADGVNVVSINDGLLSYTSTRTDLQMYYEKIGIAFGPSSGREVNPDYPSTSIDIQPRIDEYRIVGSRGREVSILAIIAGDGITPTKNITATLSEPINDLDVNTPIRIEGISTSGYDGQYVVKQVISPTQVVYEVANPPVNPAPSTLNATLNISVDTVSSASPYIFNVASKTVWGRCGLHADGSKVTGFKSVVVAQFTGIGLQKDPNAFVKYNTLTGTFEDKSATGNENIQTDSRARYKPTYENYHIKVSNDAYVQNVSVFAIGYSQQFLAESGADQSINASNSNFGAKALVARGYKDSAFIRDDAGYITHIIPPKEIGNSFNTITFDSIDVGITTSVGISSQLYLYNRSSLNIPPESVVEGYRIGAKRNDELKVVIGSTECSAKILMSNGISSAENLCIVGRSNSGINSISSNTLIFTQNHTLTNGESVRVISSTGQLPDGISANKLYYTITTGNDNQIKLAQTLNDAIAGSEININNKGGVLTVASRVSDKIAGEIGHPLQYNPDKGWYINVNSGNNIYNALAGITETATRRTYLTRQLDGRSSSDTIYRLRYVIPSSSTVARPPLDGFVIQESSSTLGTSDAEVGSRFNPSTATLSSSTQLRNQRLIAGATWSGGVATYIAELAHNLSVGSYVEVKNIKSTNNVSGTTNNGYNGVLLVTGIINRTTFTASITTDPGSFINNTSNRTLASPYFSRKKLQNIFYIYRTEEVQQHIAGKQDGIYYLTVLNSSNSPVEAPFNNLKYSQPVQNLFPQFNRDNPTSDPKEASSFALPEPLGQVVVNEPEYSVTRETLQKVFLDSSIGIGITNIISNSAGTAHTFYTSVDHGLNPATLVNLTNAGSGYGVGSGSIEYYYNAKLENISSNGENATARVTVSAAGAISSVRIMNGGSNYSVGDSLRVVGIATTTGYSAGIVSVSRIYNHIGEGLKLSKTNDSYNTSYIVSGITSSRSINVSSASSIVSTGSTGSGSTIVPNPNRVAGLHLDGNLTDTVGLNSPHGSGLTWLTSGQKFGSGAVAVASTGFLYLAADNLQDPNPITFSYPFGQSTYNRDFVFRFWVKIPNASDTAYLATSEFRYWSQWGAKIAAGVLAWDIYYEWDGYQPWPFTTINASQTFGSVPANEWAFIEIGRINGIVRGSINGVVSSNTLAMSNTLSWEDGLMYAVFQGNTMDVTIDDFEFLTGTGPRTANFTPPTAPFSDSTIITNGIGTAISVNGYAELTGPVIGISSITYSSSGIATVNTIQRHGLYVDNKVLFGGFTSSYYNNTFTVDSIVSPTSFRIATGTTNSYPTYSDAPLIYRQGTSSNGGSITKSNENISGRMVPIYAGITTVISNPLNSTSTTIPIFNAQGRGLKLGDYLLIDDEIIRISTTVTLNSSVTAFRGLLGTRNTSHPSGSIVYKISPFPVELRRNSLIRASAHTFEYNGFGPGNYSSALPDRQDRTLSPQEELIAQATKEAGGIVVFSGMNSDGDFYVGNKKVSSATGSEEVFDTPIIAVTGEDSANIALNDVNTSNAFINRSLFVEGGTNKSSISQFDGPVVFNNKIVSNSAKGIEALNLYLQGSAKSARLYTIGETIPTTVGTPGDVQYNANPLSGGFLGWVFTSNGIWEQFGKIGSNGGDLRNTVGISSNSSFVGLSTLIDIKTTGIVLTSSYDTTSGITTLNFVGASPLGNSIGISTGSNNTFVGMATQINFRGDSNIIVSGISSGITTITVGLSSNAPITGTGFIKKGATTTNFLKAGGDDAALTSNEVTTALGYVPANSASIIGDSASGNSVILDALTDFDGVTTDFTLNLNGNAYVPFGSAANLIVSIGGIIQKPGTDYYIVQLNSLNTSTIRFTTAPQVGLSHFIIALGGQSSLLGNASWNAKGDLAVGIADNNAAILGIGTNGQVLTVDTTQSVGMGWTTPRTIQNDTTWNAKGDLIVGSANDSASIVSVGSTGSILLANPSSVNGVQWVNTPLAGFRNAIINGNFDIWQRGYSFTANDYGADRWINSRVGSACIMSLQNFTLGQTDVPGEPRYFIRMSTTSSTGVSNYVALTQRIEGVRTFAGQTVTVSFYVKADSSKPISIELSQYFGSGGSSSATVTGIGVQKVIVGSSWTKVVATVAIPSISSKTIGSNGDDYLEFNIFLDAGSNFNSRTSSLGQQSGVFDISSVQIEHGSVATFFEPRPFATELALCQRYYYQTSNQYDFYGRAGSSSATTYTTIVHEFPVMMRIAPTFSANDATFTSGNCSISSHNTTPRRHFALLGLSNTPDLDCYFILATGKLIWKAEL